MNLADPEHARMLTEREFNKLFEDIVFECSKHIDLEHIFIIKTHNSTIGAEPGSVFLVTKSKEDSLTLIRSLKNIKYNMREIRVACVPEDTYKLFFERLGM